MKADLHCHSHYSDGTLSPAQLVSRAGEQGLTHLAITDHDCITPDPKVVSAAVTVIPGVEISCSWRQREIHVVGLWVDADHADLDALLLAQQERRHRRIQAFDDKLRALSIDGLMPYLETLPCLAVTRTHVADFLVQEGVCKNHQRAFKQFLAKRGRIHVPAEWPSLHSVVATIEQSGGLSIVAHPGRYPLGKQTLLDLLRDFKQAGGVALEASYGNVDPLVQRRLQDLAEELDLYLSQGSDFHADAAHWTALGKFPPMPTRLAERAIWSHPGWQAASG